MNPMKTFYTKFASYVLFFYMYSHIEFGVRMHNLLKTTIQFI